MTTLEKELNVLISGDFILMYQVTTTGLLVI